MDSAEMQEWAVFLSRIVRNKAIHRYPPKLLCGMRLVSPFKEGYKEWLRKKQFKAQLQSKFEVATTLADLEEIERMMDEWQ